MLRRVLFFVASFCFVLPVQAEEMLRLPYTAGESMLVSRGYETPSTHINKDRFALDFVQGACKSYGTPVRAAERGRVTFVNTRDTWGGGYGKNIILTHAGGKTSRYAHLSEYAENSVQDTEVRQGQIIGYQGNTGNVLGAACAAHPGTHLHFSYLENGVPIKPEPMSLYSVFQAGNWYISDNIFLEPSGGIVSKKNWFSSLWDKFVASFLKPEPPYVNPSHAIKNSVQRGGVAHKPDIAPSTTLLLADTQPVGAFDMLLYVYEVEGDRSEVEVKVKINNTGKIAWEEGSVSLNIVGGEHASAYFYHPNWMTKLRPAKNTHKVLPSTSVDLSFSMAVPREEKNTAQFQLVHTNGKIFSRIDTQYAKIVIIRKSSTLTEGGSENKKEVIVEKNESDVVNTVALFIPEVYSAGSHGSTSFIEVASVAIPVEDSVMEQKGEVVVVAPPVSAIDAPVVIVTSTSGVVVPTTTSMLEEISLVMPNEPVTNTSTVVSSTEHVLPDEENLAPMSFLCSSVTNTPSIFFPSSALLQPQLISAESVIVLTAEHGPYIFGIDTVIPKGKTLILEEGITVYAADKKATLVVEGKLVVKGTEAHPVVFTSLCGENNSAPGDWSHIFIAGGGVVSMEYASIRYAGSPFTISHGALASSETVSRVFFNQGGSLSLHYVMIQDSHIKTTDEKYSAYVWIENAPNHEVSFVSEQNVYTGGYAAIHIEGTNNDQRIQGNIIGNTFNDFRSPFGPITIHRDVPSIEDNYFTGNIRNGVYFESAIFLSSHTLEKEKEYWFSGMTIDKNAVMTVLPGAILRLLPGTDMIVLGEFLVQGTEEEPVKILADTTKWGSIIITDGIARFDFVDMSGGGLSASVPPGMSRMIYAVDSDISIDGSHIHDSRIPGALIDAKNSSVFVLDSVLSWEALPPVAAWKTYGIFMTGGEVSIIDTVFHNVVVPMYATPETVVHEEEVPDPAV